MQASVRLARFPKYPFKQMQAPRCVEPVLLPVSLLEGQFVQTVAPVCVEYVPAKQAAQAWIWSAPDAVEKVPDKQDAQAKLVLAPDAVEKVPAAQGVHTVSRTPRRTVLYVPAEQAVHPVVPVPVLNVPAGHEGQAVLLVLVQTADWKVPGKHVLQLRHQTLSVACWTSPSTP